MSYLKRKRQRDSRKAKRESWTHKLAEWFGLVGAVDKQYTLTNVDNLTYHGAINMGDPDTAVSVVFDTGSLGLAVQGPACTTNCAVTTYNAVGSADYVADTTAWTHVYKNNKQSDYWITATGTEATDKITIDSDNLPAARFYLISGLSITSADAFTPVNTGWLGLTLNAEATAVNTFDFIEQLEAATLLTNK